MASSPPMDPLPPTWSAGRSTAALIAYAGTFTSQRMSQLQIALTRWELEKYGPCFHEPFSEVVIEDGVRALAGLSPDEGRIYATMHGGEILRRRGREILDLALSASARVAALGPQTNPAVFGMLHDVSTYARGTMAISDARGEIQLGEDEARDMALSAVLPTRPTFDELAHQLGLVTQLLERPAGWTEAHAMAFLIAAGHVVDRAVPGPVPDRAQKLMQMFATMFECTASPTELLGQGEALVRRCQGLRFVVNRVVEDQLMHFTSFDLDVRQIVVKVVNDFAAEAVTPWRRALITAAMAVLATSPKAVQRERHCPPWPQLR